LSLELLLRTGEFGGVVGIDPATLANATILVDYDVDVDTDAEGVTRQGNAGSAIDFTQAVDDDKPDETAFSIQYNGITQQLIGDAIANLRGAAAYSMIWAIEFLSIGTDDAGLNNEGWFRENGNTLACVGRSSNKVGIHHFTSTGTKLIHQSVSATVAKHVMGAIWDGSTLFCAVDANDFDSVASTAPTGTSTGRMGRSFGFLDGHIAHGAMYNDEKSQATVRGVMDFYNAKWASF